ncbi:hypothetical protein [Oceanobacillus halotolerans]|uniref:hypothetical protein n=1 Tax=Oceanobacillus halotolerans TaxID=2663380 RepID=UPI0013DA492B|nr:hypothetical protein [Oceanobacillus halotolerans]
MNTDELLSEMSPILEAFSGGRIASKLTGVLVKNMDITYWVGEDDDLVHHIDLKVSCIYLVITTK